MLNEDYAVYLKRVLVKGGGQLDQYLLINNGLATHIIYIDENGEATKKMTYTHPEGGYCARS